MTYLIITNEHTNLSERHFIFHNYDYTLLITFILQIFLFLRFALVVWVAPECSWLRNIGRVDREGLTLRVSSLGCWGWPRQRFQPGCCSIMLGSLSVLWPWLFTVTWDYENWALWEDEKTLVYHVFCQSLARAGSSTYVDASHGGAVDVKLKNFSFTGNYNL